MLLTLILLFAGGYVLITLEHPLKINKTAIALITGVSCWTVYAVLSPGKEEVVANLGHHLIGIAEILFFLLGAYRRP